MNALLTATILLAATTAHTATLEIDIDSVESNAGDVYVALCVSSFDRAGCPYGAREPARTGRMVFTFYDIPPGRYAVAAYQDVNGNGKLDTYVFGLPAEPYGFSNNVGRSGPPDFQRALVSVTSGLTRVSVHLHRLFGSG